MAHGTEKPPVKLTVSDWIAFLSNEKNSGLSNVIGVAGVFIAVIVIILDPNGAAPNSPAGYGWVRPVAVGFSGIALLLLAINTLRALGRPASRAQKLLDRIMRGDPTLRTVEQIRQEWARPKKRAH